MLPNGLNSDRIYSGRIRTQGGVRGVVYRVKGGKIVEGQIAVEHNL